jgi:hypothetical protein
MKRLNLGRGRCKGRLSEKGCAATAGWVSRFAGHLQQAISNFQLLGIGNGLVANAVLFVWLFHRESAISAQGKAI